MNALTSLFVVLLIAPLASAQEVTVQGAPTTPVPSRDRFPDWAERDAEGRWALIAEDYARDPNALSIWIPFLAEEGAQRELEWIATSFSLGTQGALDALVAADAPSWMRVAGWRIGFKDSHSDDWSRKPLEERPELLLGWAARYERLLSPELTALRDEVAAKDPTIVPADEETLRRYLPPLTRDDVYRPLFEAAAAVPFGERRVAEPGAVYEHQVERALHAMEASGRRGKAALTALLGLATHRSERLALRALLAFSSFEPQEVPDEELSSIAQDPSVSEARRDAAFLASTYGIAPRVFVRLHEVAANPTQVHWTAALDRLGELGTGFTVRHLEPLRDSALTRPQRALLELHLRQLRERARMLEQELAPKLQGWLELAAWADLASAPIARELVQWTQDTIRAGLEQENVRNALAKLADSYEPGRGMEAPSGSLRERVRELAAGLVR